MANHCSMRICMHGDCCWAHCRKCQAEHAKNFESSWGDYE